MQDVDIGTIQFRFSVPDGWKTCNRRISTSADIDLRPCGFFSSLFKPDLLSLNVSKYPPDASNIQWLERSTIENIGKNRRNVRNPLLIGNRHGVQSIECRYTAATDQFYKEGWVAHFVRNGHGFLIQLNTCQPVDRDNGRLVLLASSFVDSIVI